MNGPTTEVRRAGAPDAPALELLSGTVSLARALEGGVVHVALVRDVVVGYAVSNESFFARPFLSLLFVAGEHRRCGLGTALVEAVAENWAPTRLFTSTNCSNTAMQRLLAAGAWRPCGLVDGLDEGDPELFYYRDPAR